MELEGENVMMNERTEELTFYAYIDLSMELKNEGKENVLVWYTQSLTT